MRAALRRLRRELLALVETPATRPNWLWLMIYWPVMRYFRPRRMARLAAYFQLTPRSTVLDVGGMPFNWGLLPVGNQPRLTLLNRERPHWSSHPWVVADGRCLPFRDGAFDLVYSNSVIEHLGTLEEQRRLARELRRVGRSFYVQTPNRAFFIEPHLIAPFIHWLPRRWQRRLIRPLTLWGWIQRPSARRVEAFLDEVRLLDEGELRALFPGATIWRERLGGMTKSLSAVGGPRQD